MKLGLDRWMSMSKILIHQQLDGLCVLVYFELSLPEGVRLPHSRWKIRQSFRQLRNITVTVFDKLPLEVHRMAEFE